MIATVTSGEWVAFGIGCFVGLFIAALAEWFNT